MRRLGEEFKAKAKEKGITKWIIHNCSMCDYPCGYHISEDAQQVAYDSGCNCGRYSDWQQRNWDDLAGHYNIQDHPDCIKKYDEFWGFESAAQAA